ncbi:MAG TPA: 6,7-dimethyl-8-ribityllumazine synthase [Caulobacteraceae bacterium]|nr:6,7-dimethyl-8-ribityllumazine synthase [Caulobacteraceae bacterium]
MADKKPRVLIVEARYYSDLADELLAGAVSTLQSLGATHEVVTVPGALEIPAAIAFAEHEGGYDGYVALGCVIRGETHHFEVVANESARALMDLSVKKRLAVGNAILTVEDEEQAWARARTTEGDKGGGAARACLDMIALKRQLKDDRK